MYALLSIFAIVSSGLIVPLGTHRDDVEIPVSEVPEVVRKAADEALPRVRWEVALREVVDGKTHYALEGKDARDRDISVAVTAAGDVLFAAISIREEEVPDTVREALKRAAPDFKPTQFGEVIRDGKLAGYAFEGEPTARVAGAFIDPEGRKVQLIDEAGDPL